jgi:hypothetical protein
MNWVVVVCSLHGDRLGGHNYGYHVSTIRFHTEEAADEVANFLEKQSTTGRIQCHTVEDGEVEK